MVDLTWHDYGRQTADGTPNTLTQIADVATDALCNLYYHSPAAFITNDGGGGPIFGAQRALLDTACAPRHPLPPLPVPPFDGGQCPVYYNLTTTLTARSSNDGGASFDSASTVVVQGDVRSIYRKDIGEAVSSGIPGGRLAQIICICRNSNASPSSEPAPDGYHSYVLASSNPFAYVGYSSSFARLDGQPDNCGDPAPVYPPNTVTNNDFRTTNNINVSPTINVPVSITVVPTFAPVTNIFRPELNIDVGGINVNVSLGGLTFSPALSIPINVPVPSPIDNVNPVTPKPIPPGGTSGGTGVDLTGTNKKVDDAIKAINDCCDSQSPHPKPKPDKTDVTEIGSGRSGVFVVPDRCFKISLEMTARSTNEKEQDGVLAPSVLYAGWAWFIDEGKCGERVPVDNAGKFYSVPERFSGSFAYTLYKGYSATIKAYSAKLPTT